MKTAILRLSAALLVFASGVAAQSPPAETTAHWNVYVEGRLLGVTDRTSNQQTLGSYVTLGADKGVSPWLTLGLGVNYEHLFTRNWSVPGASTSEDGWGLQPYATARLSPNLYFTPFAAATRLTYNASLGAGQTAQFGAWRWLAGATCSASGKRISGGCSRH